MKFPPHTVMLASPTNTAVSSQQSATHKAVSLFLHHHKSPLFYLKIMEAMFFPGKIRKRQKIYNHSHHDGDDSTKSPTTRTPVRHFQGSITLRHYRFAVIFLITTFCIARSTEAAFTCSSPPPANPRSFLILRNQYRSTTSTSTARIANSNIQLGAFFRNRGKGGDSSSSSSSSSEDKKKKKKKSKKKKKKTTIHSEAAGTGQDDGDNDDMLHFPSNEEKMLNNEKSDKVKTVKHIVTPQQYSQKSVAQQENAVPSSSATTTITSTTASADNKNNKNVEWHVYVDQSKPSMERGAGATLDAFIGLSPPQVQVHSVIFRSKSKGPVVRCVRFATGDDNTSKEEEQESGIEISNVDSVDKVFRILTFHMNLKGYVDNTARECLNWKYKGNAHLEAGEITEALEAYDYALATTYKPQEGIVLLMRATAYLRRASQHQETLRELVSDFQNVVTPSTKLQTAYEQAAKHPSLANPILKRVLDADTHNQHEYEGTKYRHGLYQYALLHAAQDALRATQLLPQYSKSWLRAGQILNELWKLKESTQYYEKALEVDPSLADKLKPIIDNIAKRQELLDGARQYGWTQDETIRIALDVVG